MNAIRSPDEAKRNPGTPQTNPDFASPHPGYEEVRRGGD
jgi:hypothetical protein